MYRGYDLKHDANELELALLSYTEDHSHSGTNEGLAELIQPCIMSQCRSTHITVSEYCSV